MDTILFNIVVILIFQENGCSIITQWEKFQIDYGKNYTKSEDTKHFRNFRESLKEINRHNKRFKKGVVTYQKGITEFADLTDEEFINMYGLDKQTEIRYPNDKISNSTEYLNWREKGAVTEVKNQGICGSCYIFGAIGVIEGYLYRKQNKLITLSEQNYIDCSGKEACNGGFSDNVLADIRDRQMKLNPLKDYPNTGQLEGSCRFDELKAVDLDVHSFTHKYPVSENQMKEVLDKYGPIAISIYGTKKWRLYRSGVWFETKCAPTPNHAVLLVGYGTENGHDYWLIKNSAGKNWGLDGYIKIARNLNTNYCGIETDFIYIE